MEQVIETAGTNWDQILSSSSENSQIATPSNCTMAVSCFKEELSMFTLRTSGIEEIALELLSLFLFPRE